jgi:hypothetical protein
MEHLDDYLAGAPVTPSPAAAHHIASARGPAAWPYKFAAAPIAARTVL